MPLLNDDNFKSSEAISIDFLLSKLKPHWGYSQNEINDKDLKKCYSFSTELLSNSPEWLSSVKRYAKRFKESQYLLKEALQNGAYRSVLHHARLTLMLADYNYSSKDEDTRNWVSNLKLYANTSAPKVFNQHLDCLLYTSPSPRDQRGSRMPSSA